MERFKGAARAIRQGVSSGRSPVVLRATGAALILVTLPMLAATIPIVLGAAPVIIVLCMAAATSVSAAAIGVSTMTLGHQLERRHRALDAERRDWESKALSDPMTGVANRRGVEQRTDYLSAGDPELRWTVLVCDVDHFKGVNDQYGHAVGDRALMTLADTLVACCPNGATVGRLGGDEFVIYAALPDLVTERWAEEVLSVLRGRPIHTREGSLTLSFSYGIAIGEPGEEFDTVTTVADSVLIARKVKRHAGAERQRDASSFVVPDWTVDAMISERHLRR